MAFNPGDVVVIRSGGPVMTVERVGQSNGHEAVFCTWFEKGKQERGHFAPAAIEIYKEEDPIYPQIG
jgi:uncharacterized protein YodC (DUF2158 family)